MPFNKWLDTFVDEKALNTEHVFEVYDQNDEVNLVPLDVVIEFLKSGLDARTKKEIKNQVVFLDFKNGDFYQYFGDLAYGMVRAANTDSRME